MTGSKNGNETETKSPRESGEDSEDESEILEESPCGRWSKRRQEVSQPLLLYCTPYTNPTINGRLPTRKSGRWCISTCPTILINNGGVNGGDIWICWGIFIVCPPPGGGMTHPQAGQPPPSSVCLGPENPSYFTGITLSFELKLNPITPQLSREVVAQKFPWIMRESEG